jgi:hypothetical protein
VPLTAAAVVAALAVTLVLVRNMPNGRGPTPVTSAAPTGPGGIPRYYAAIAPLHGKAEGPAVLLVADSLTGKTVATIAPPAGLTFVGVRGSADDRTFAVYATSSTATTLTSHWFEARISPGTAHPARLLPLPIRQAPIPLQKGLPTSSVFGMALSASGAELAVARVGATRTGVAVRVYSVATGRVLHQWTTSSKALTVPGPWQWSLAYQGTLAWTDADHALTLTTDGPATSSGSTESVRRVSVDEPDGDLLARSQVIWSTPPRSSATTSATGEPCGLLLFTQMPPLVSADGKTAACARGYGQDSWTVAFDTYRLGTGTVAADKGTVVYQVSKKSTKPTGSQLSGAVLWISPDGGTLIGEWAIAIGTASSVAPRQQAGVISHGTFTPLRLVAGYTLSAFGSIAW